MNKLALILLAVCIAGVSAASVNTAASIFQKSTKGVVSPIARCGGVGTPIQLEVSECEGRCRLTPGKQYEIKGTIIPSSASPSLGLSLDLIYEGFVFRILDTTLENSSVQPGVIYTVTFYMVPNDVLSGNAVVLRAQLFHSDTKLVEICVSAEVDIL